MRIPALIRIENIWGNEFFKKENWGSINYLIGPNGSGKTQFIQSLIPILTGGGLKVRYLSSDRLVSWTKQQNLVFVSSALSSGGLNLDWLPDIKQMSRTRGEVNDAFALLRDNLMIRIKVEATLSQLLNRSIYLEERGGYLIPKLARTREEEYSFK